MAKQQAGERMAVCSWSLQPGSAEELATKLKEAGVLRTQLALDPLRNSPESWRRVPETFQRHGLSVVSGMFGCVGEDYTTLESIRLTGGIVPDETWETNRRNIALTADLAHDLGLKLVTFHAGFVPHEPANESYAKLLGRLGEIADLFARKQIALGLETGQEKAPALALMLQKLARPNLGVNFDPANMVLYDQGDPVDALGVLGPWIRQVHIKDALRTTTPGTWGREVPVGTGCVDWRAFFGRLEQIKYAGDFVIEREAGAQRVQDIRAAAALIQRLLQPEDPAI